jgi:diguanylate cyclase (GGDEF)-like protein/PAS domain S-box-containing protein
VVPPERDEARLRALFENTPEGLTFFDREGRLTDANPGATRLLRSSREALLGQPCERLMAPESHEEGKALFARALAGESVESDLTLLRADGERARTHVAVGPLRIGEEITGAFVCARDVDNERDAREELEDSEERFRSIFDNNPDAMIAFDAEGAVTRANAGAGRMLESEPHVLVHMTLGDLVEEADLAVALGSFNRALAGIAGGVEFRIRTASAEPIPAFVTMIPIRFSGQAAGVHLHVRDLRPELAQQRQIAAHAERIRDLYLSAAAANDTAEQQIAATIDAGCRILGMSSGSLYETETDQIIETRGEPLAPRLTRLAIATDRALAVDDLRGVPYFEDAGSFTAFIGTAITVAGSRFGSLCFADRRKRRSPFDEVDRDLVQLMGALVGSAIERGRSRARLRTLAYTDTVTTLPNRAWFIEHLGIELENAANDGGSVGVLFLDLDRFKDINDTLGHESGDTLLRIIGERLAKAIRTQDLVARMGGDEFIVLALGAPDRPALSALAERIIASIEEPVQLSGTEHFVTASIGIASYPADGRDAETLVKHADVAMYRAKDRGRNTYQFFTPALNATLQTRLSQEKTLRRALAKGEFVVYYQPQHDLQTGKIIGVEALVRWNHPRSGLVLPGQFIPNAELSGLIVAIGDFVLESACADTAALRATIAPDLRVAVNLSARQFHQQRLATKIRAIVERTSLDPTALELEITESVAMNDAAVTINIMRELGTEGVRLAVDDFGTGYSSLGYLRRFPLDLIKIDRSFVTDLANESDDATIVRTVIAMAHALDLEVIAEGVETAEQLSFLSEQRCDCVQGFYFSQAIPRAELEAYIQAGAAPVPAG